MLSSNIRPYYKGFPETNTLANYETVIYKQLSFFHLGTWDVGRVVFSFPVSLSFAWKNVYFVF